MPYTDSGKARMLAGLDSDTNEIFISLHSAYPGATGENEVSGGSPPYSRKLASLASAAGGARQLAEQPVFDLPNTAVAFYGLWSALTNGVMQAYGALGSGDPLRFCADPATNQVESPAHGLNNGEQVVFMGAPAPTGLSEGALYFVVNASADTMQLSLTQGGAVIDISGTQNGASLVKVAPITTLASGGKYVLPDIDLAI